MLLEQAVQHYESLGWSVERSPEIPLGRDTFRPDLLVSRGGKRRAVRVDEDPLGKFQIGMLAAACKRGGLQAVVICPASEDVVAACEEFGVEYLSPEGLGRAAYVPRAGPPVEAPAPADATPAEVAVPLAVRTPSRRVPWWRWAVVAIVWGFALYFVWRWFELAS